jgi:hypothetical protein
MSRRWLTPDEIAEADMICRPLNIDRVLLPFATGALAELTNPHAWEETGTMTPQRASEYFAEALFELTGECSAGGAICEVPVDPDFELDITIKIIRRGAGGHTEELVDGVWTMPAGDYEVPPVPARVEVDRLCLAAANAANVLAVMYEEITDRIAIELSVANVIGAIYDVAISLLGLFAGNSAVAYASLGKTFLDAFIQTADTLGSDVWTPDFTTELTCFMYEEATDTAGVITFDWVALRDGITTKFLRAAASFDTDRALLWSQVGYLFDILAAGGINHAGATTAITEYDCLSCGDWCYEFDFANGQQGWFTYGEYGVFSNDGTRFVSTLVAGDSARGIGIRRVMVDTHITRILVTYFTGANVGSGASNQVFLAVRSNGAYVETSPNLVVQQGNPRTDEFVFDATGDELHVFMSVPSTANSISITKVLVEGTGGSPFGPSNC